MAKVWWVGLCGAILVTSSCGSDSGAGGEDAGFPLSENTASMCQDGKDNDGDGFVDCDDQDCWPLALCETSRPDGWKPPDAGPQDGSVDSSGPGDGPPPDGVQQSCSTHCDCQQGWFCYKGSCVQDPKMPAYCCAKPGCPPGRWCVDYSGIKSICGEDPSYVCTSACDCGPAHCCIPDSKGINRCVKDTSDPWLPGGTAIGGATCNVGTDPTYCCGDAECHVARRAYGSKDDFRCHNPSKAKADTFCGGAACFGSSCACADGEVCLDTLTQPMPPAGTTCRLLSGGSCVGAAAAEALFGVSSADLLPCCKAGCMPGTSCDAGWKRIGGKYAYQRVVGTCGACSNGTHWSCGLCGNKTCDEGEAPDTCPKDCKCGDGVCAPKEYTDNNNPDSCPADCGECGDGQCDADETPNSSAPFFAHCAADCGSCGDGWCSGSEAAVGSCPQDCQGMCSDVGIYPPTYRVCGDGICGDAGCEEPENCRTCSLDCGPCRPWTILQVPEASLTGVWGFSATDVLVVGGPSILRYDGKSWKATDPISAVSIWGSSPTELFVLGTAGASQGVSHYDGKTWAYTPLLPWCGCKVDSCRTCQLSQVWGSSATAVWVVGQEVIDTEHDQITYNIGFQFDGSAWKAMDVGGTGVWASSPTDVFVVGGGVSHYDGVAWSLLSSPDPTWRASRAWGFSPTDVFFVGRISDDAVGSSVGSVAHYDGGSLKVVSTLPLRSDLTRVWGNSPTNLFVAGVALAVSWVGPDGPRVQGSPIVLHYDGAKWSRERIDRREIDDSGNYSCPVFNAIWGTSAGDIFAVGGDAIYHCPASACGSP